MAEEAMSGPVLCDIRLSFYCRWSRRNAGHSRGSPSLELDLPYEVFLFDLDLPLAARATRVIQEVAGGKVGRARGFLEVIENKGERNVNWL